MADSLRSPISLAVERVLAPQADEPLPWATPWRQDAQAAERADGLSVGDAVQLVGLPDTLARMSRSAQRRFGRLLGEVFEIVAFTLPGELAIARWTQAGGEMKLQVFYVTADCVEPWSRKDG